MSPQSNWGYLPLLFRYSISRQGHTLKAWCITGGAILEDYESFKRPRLVSEK